MEATGTGLVNNILQKLADIARKWEQLEAEEIPSGTPLGDQ